MTVTLSAIYNDELEILIKSKASKMDEPITIGNLRRTSKDFKILKSVLSCVIDSHLESVIFHKVFTSEYTFRMDFTPGTIHTLIRRLIDTPNDNGLASSILSIYFDIEII